MKIIRIKEEDSLSQLNNTKIVDEIIDFLRKNPFPKDHEQFHKYFEDKGYKEEEIGNIEQYVYAMLSIILTGGASKGKEIKASDENLKIGYEIEKEHVETGINNKVVKHIEDILRKKISYDHLAETDTYYVDGVNFKNELKQEQ